MERPRPTADEILVELAATSINPADWQLGAGYARGVVDFPMPFTPGMDFAGVVREVGSDVEGFAIGDRVFGAELIARSGTYAEFVAVSAAIVAHLPATVSMNMAAAVPLAALTAWEATVGAAHGNVRAGQHLLVQGGGGGTGTFAIQFAKQRGAYVIATSSARNNDLLRSLGADEVVDYEAVRFDDVIDSVDTVIDLVGGDVPLRSIPLIRKDGMLASIVPLPDTIAQCEVAARQLGVRLSFVNMSVNRNRETLAKIARQLEAGTLRVVVSETYPLTEASKALTQSRTGHVRGKIVMEIGSPE